MPLPQFPDPGGPLTLRPTLTSLLTPRPAPGRPVGHSPAACVPLPRPQDISCLCCGTSFWSLLWTPPLLPDRLPPVDLVGVWSPHSSPRLGSDSSRSSVNARAWPTPARLHFPARAWHTVGLSKYLFNECTQHSNPGDGEADQQGDVINRRLRNGFQVSLV